MKNNKSIHIYRQWIILSCILISFGLITIYLIIMKNENKKESYLDSEIKSFSSKVTSILGSYENFTNYIFYENKHQKEIFSIVSEANSSNNQRKKELAITLKKKLKEDYKSLTSYGFSKVNFLLSSGEIFLSFQPEYDRNKLKFNKNSRLSNTEKKFFKSFEKGDLYSNYMYVYFMTYKYKYLGAIEMIIPLENLMKIFSNFYPNINMDYLVKKSILFPVSNFDTQVKPVQKIYLFDNYVNYFSIKNNGNLKYGKEILYFEKIKKKIQKEISTDKSFGIFTDFEDKKYISLFIAIKGKKNETIGYLISTYEDFQYEKLSDSLYMEIIFVNLIIIVSLMGTFIFIKDRNKFQELSSNDYLTGLYNRTKFMEISNYELIKCARYRSNFSILLIDIDYFKNVNDHFGHNTGDEVLKTVASLLKNNIRQTDIIARWGGEEFICLLPDTGAEIASFVGEKLRIVIESSKFEQIGKITVSIGVHEKSDYDFTIESVNEKADIALYEAKKTGRNKVVIYKEWDLLKNI